MELVRNKPKVFSLILPCFNEEEAVIPVLDLALELKGIFLRCTDITDFEVIMVDDCSTDMTAYLVEQFSRSVRVVRTEKNLGYGGALKRGFAEARGEFVAFYDVDYTYDPYALVEMYLELERSALDMVCGDRLHNITNMPFTRCIGNFFFRTVIRSIFGQEVEDSCTGQRIFRSKYIPVLTKLLPNNLDFSLGMTLLFLHFNLPFLEIPVEYHRRLGRSKLSVLSDGVRFLLTIMRYSLQFRFREGKFREALPQVGV